MRLTSHHHVVLMLRMRGYVPPFSHTSSCRGFELDIEKTLLLIFKNNTISELYHCVIEAFALLGCYTAYGGSWLPTFRDSLLVPFPRVKDSPWTVSPLKMGPIDCPETPRNIPEEARPQAHRGGRLKCHSVIALIFCP
jgi:hypothetical protein